MASGSVYAQTIGPPIEFGFESPEPSAPWANCFRLMERDCMMPRYSDLPRASRISFESLSASLSGMTAANWIVVHGRPQPPSEGGAPPLKGIVKFLLVGDHSSVKCLYRGHRFPPEIISHAVWLYHRFTLSVRDVEDLLAERGVTVSYEAIRLWCRKFGPAYAHNLRRRQGRLGDVWHLDEVFIRIRGERY